MFRRKQAAKHRQSGLRARAADRSQFTYYSSAAGRPRNEGAEAVVDLTQKHPSRLRWTPTVIAIIVIVGSILFSLTLTSRPTVETLHNEPSPYRSLDEYADAASRIMQDNLSSLTKFTVNTHEVEDKLLEQFPELKAAVLRLPILGRKPNLVLDIEPPVLLLATPAKSFVLDGAGTVISEVGALSMDARAGLLVIKDQSGLAIEVGKHALPSDTVQFITEAVAYLKAQNLTVSELTLPQSANQLDIRVEGTAYYIKTDIGGNARLQIGSFLAVKQKLEGDRITPAEYIDVRVEEKVFYR